MMKHKIIKIIGIAGVLGVLSFLPGASDGILVYNVQAYEDEYLLIDSSIRILTDSDVEGFSLQGICYAKNEIYARKRRMFKSTELNEYFSSKRWYSGDILPEDFQESSLSEIEKANVEFLSQKEYEMDPAGYQLDQPGYDITLVSSCINKDSFETAVSKIKQGEGAFLGKNVSLDLNQDGTEETLAVSVDWDTELYATDQYTLQVGDCVYSDFGENTQEAVYGISMDGNEILPVIYQSGPSEDPVSTIFRYDGNSLSMIGQICTWPENMKIEDGVLHTKIRCNTMGTMAIETSWILDENGQLSMLKQDAYEYGKDFTYPGEPDDFFAYLKQTITVYSEKDEMSTATEMEPQYVNFPYTDGENWTYVQGESGQGGWLYLNEPYYEQRVALFDGLFFAD